MRRHRVHEDELPAVKLGLHWYLTENCDSPQDSEINVVHAFRLFYRVINYKAGQPDYPNIYDEEGRVDYGTIKSHLAAAESIDPTLIRMVPLLHCKGNIPVQAKEIMPVWPRTGFSSHLSSGQTSKENPL